MTVKELIRKLQALPDQNLTVRTEDGQALSDIIAPSNHPAAKNNVYLLSYGDVGKSLD